MKLILLIGLAFAACFTSAQEAIPFDHETPLRVSAILNIDQEVRVGLMNTESGQSYLLKPGDVRDDIQILDVNFSNETVRLLVQEKEIELHLTGDDALRSAWEDAMNKSSQSNMVPMALDPSRQVAAPTMDEMMRNNPPPPDIMAEMKKLPPPPDIMAEMKKLSTNTPPDLPAFMASPDTP